MKEKYLKWNRTFVNRILTSECSRRMFYFCNSNLISNVLNLCHFSESSSYVEILSISIGIWISLRFDFSTFLYFLILNSSGHQTFPVSSRNVSVFGYFYRNYTIFYLVKFLSPLLLFRSLFTWILWILIIYLVYFHKKIFSWNVSFLQLFPLFF